MCRIILFAVKATCDSVIQHNNTYFTNPGYPTSYSTPGMCMAEIQVPHGVSYPILSYTILLNWEDFMPKCRDFVLLECRRRTETSQVDCLYAG